MNLIKKLTIWVLGITIITWSIVNIRKQLVTLKVATEKNLELEGNINTLKDKTIKLKSLTEYASSSASIQRQSRELLGKGTDEDYWLILPKDIENIKSDTIPIAKEEESNLFRWIHLFTNSL